MRRFLITVAATTILASPGCSDDQGSGSSATTKGPTTAGSVTEPAVAVTSSTAPTADASPTSVATIEVAPPTTPDLGADVFWGYDDALLSMNPSDGDLAPVIERADAATPTQAWNEAMVIALMASYCGNWDAQIIDDMMGPPTEQGYSDWAAAVAGPLRISEANARLAVRWVYDDPGRRSPCQ